MNPRACAGRLATIALIAGAGAATPVCADERPPVAAIAPPHVRTAEAAIDAPLRKASPGKRDVFAPHSWAPPAAPRPKPTPVPEFRGPPEPPPPPLAPPLTLVYLGQLDVDGEPTVYYLAQGDRVFAVTAGDTIDGTYRVLAREGRDLPLLYLPLNIKQLLPMNRPS